MKNKIKNVLGSKKNLAGIGSVAIIAIIVVYLLIPKGLSGTYTTKFLGMETSYVFKGNHFVIDNSDEKSAKGTYQIKDNKLILKNDVNEKITANLSDDKKSFTISGFTYTKQKQK